MSSLWILLTLAAVNGAALFFMFLYFKRRISEALELDEIVSKARKEVGSMIADINQAADRSVSLLEDRVQQANRAAAEVDKAIVALAREGQRRDRERGVYEKLSRARPLVKEEGAASVQRPEALQESLPFASSPAEGEAPLRDERASSAAAGGEGARGREPPLGMAGGSPSGPRPGAPSRTEPAKPAMPEVLRAPEQVLTGKSPAERVVELWRQGFSAEIIAQRTGMTVSEIDLAIAMEEQRLLWNADQQK